MNRSVVRLALVAGLAAGPLVGLATPATAAATADFEDGCGSVTIRFDDVFHVPVNVFRSGTTARVTTVTPQEETARLTIGAAPGDELTVTTDTGAGPFTHAYQVPDGCASPSVTITAENGCQGILLLHANNTGPERVSDFFLRAFSTNDVTPLSFPVGEATLPVQVPPNSGPIGDHYLVMRGSGATEAIWLNHEFRSDPDCDPAAVGAAFTDTCDGVTVAVTSAIEAAWFYTVRRNQDLLVEAAVRSGTPGEHGLAAQPGDVFAVRLATSDSTEGGAGDIAVAEHAYARPASCDGPGGPGGGTGGEADDPLPVTGVPVALAVAAGAVLVASGAVLFQLARRRRPRFTPDG
jgi:hypothetical protein